MSVDVAVIGFGLSVPGCGFQALGSRLCDLKSRKTEMERKCAGVEKEYRTDEARWDESARDSCAGALRSSLEN